MIKSLYEQGTDKWFAEKVGKISGTRFKDMMSGEGTKGYNDLIANLAGEILTGKLEETFASKLMEEGTEKEPEGRAHLEDVLGPIEQCGFIQRDEDDEFHNWVGLSVDGLMEGQRKNFELKCPLLKTHLSYFRLKEGPPEYRWQLQGGLWVLQEEVDSTYFCSYYPGMKPFVLEVFPSEKDFAAIDARIGITIERVNELLISYEKSDDYIMPL